LGITISKAKEKTKKKYGAEFIGTFWLVLGGCGSAVLAAVFPNVGIGMHAIAPLAIFVVIGAKVSESLG
jgi:glycerol uptake facilitator-like aquaporin